MSNEAFEKALSSYADEHITGSIGLVRKIGKHFYDARQPEIDAKDKTIDDLALQKGILKAEVGRLESENEALKIRASEYRDKCLAALEENAALKAEGGLCHGTQSNAWEKAVLLQCMTIEGCYNENDPIATINCLIDWHVQMAAEDSSPPPSQDTIISWNSDLEETAKEVIAAFRADKTKLPDRILNALHELNIVLNTK